MSDDARPATTVTVEPDAAAADIQAVHDGLRAYNVTQVGPSGERPVHVFLRDADGRVVGGLSGHIKWKWLYVAKLWVSDGYRSAGAGTRLMLAAEQYAREQGATNASLDTFGYQARPFYEKLGYRVFGTLEGFPPGSCQYFLTKPL
ncbi:MAG: GNAT family N-acetyltransferase [Gemmatimonadetes bacterium]|nr:GNAT family N-acetyltransferase [Gemmatimonadota bacterium]